MSNIGNLLLERAHEAAAILLWTSVVVTSMCLFIPEAKFEKESTKKSKYMGTAFCSIVYMVIIYRFVRPV